MSYDACDQRSQLLSRTALDFKLQNLSSIQPHLPPWQTRRKQSSTQRQHRMNFWALPARCSSPSLYQHSPTRSTLVARRRRGGAPHLWIPSGPDLHLRCPISIGGGRCGIPRLQSHTWPGICSVCLPGQSCQGIGSKVLSFATEPGRNIRSTVRHLSLLPNILFSDDLFSNDLFGSLLHAATYAWYHLWDHLPLWSSVVHLHLRPMDWFRDGRPDYVYCSSTLLLCFVVREWQAVSSGR